MGNAHRKHRRQPSSSPVYNQYTTARNAYFHAVRRSKTQHWEDFLAQASEADVFKAMKYTKPGIAAKVPAINYSLEGVSRKATTFEEKCNAFITTLFPTHQPEASAAATADTGTTTYTGQHLPRPQNPQKSTSSASKDPGQWEWPDLGYTELAEAINTSSPRKAPGPNRVGFAVIQRAYKVYPDIFNRIYRTLFSIGYHPKAWRQAIGIILPKPGKEDYTIPKAYRVIALLNCLGKILEKIVASRLGYLASTKISILNNTQMGGRQQRSAIDTALLLLHYIQGQRVPKKGGKRPRNVVTTTVFLDIKGAFDYVKKPQLLRIIEELGLPQTLRNWVDCFVTDRSIQLAFEGQIQQPTPLTTGVPQGSPVSPILFLLYVSHIIGKRGLQLSYIDDFSLSVTSRSAAKNCRELEAIIDTLFDLASEKSVIFDPSKTELIHFHTHRKPVTEALRVGDITISPKEVVRWLGVWFDSKLTFKPHVEKRVALATAAFFRLQRLGSTQKRLSFRGLRQLYVACIAPIADYGFQLWWGSKKATALLRPYNKLQAIATPLILGAFRGSPQKALELEASIPPPEVRFERACDGYSLRIHQAPWTHPVKAAVSSLVRDDLGESGSEDDNRASAASVLSYLEPTTQLLRLVGMIRRYVEKWDLETPAADRPPWLRRSYIVTDISLEPKEIEAVDHINRVQGSLEKGVRIYYTDGSQGTIEGEKQCSAAYCRLATPTAIAAADSWNLGGRIEVADAEVFAVAKVLEAIRYGTEKLPNNVPKPVPIIIFVDSQAAILRIRNPGNNRWARKIQQMAKALWDIATVGIYWCPGHCGVYGNDVADSLAKGAIETRPCPEAYTSYSHIKRLAKAQALQHWQELWEKEVRKGPRAKGLGKHYQAVAQETLRFALKPLDLQMLRKHQSAYIQLKTGVGYIRAHQHTIRKALFDTCFGACGARQTTQHLLLECPTYRTQRATLRRALIKEKLPLTLPVLFGSTTGRLALQAFLRSTLICTAQWYYHSGVIAASP